MVRSDCGQTWQCKCAQVSCLLPNAEADPAQVEHGVWPLGGDERFLVSEDGRHLRARRRMHKGIVEYRTPADGQVEVERSYHIAILDDVPEDTDVFTVLMRTPRTPELVVTNAFVYRITIDGGIICLGKREEVLGPDPPR